MSRCPSNPKQWVDFCALEKNVGLRCCSLPVDVNGEHVRVTHSGATTGSPGGGGVKMPNPDEIYATSPDLLLRRVGRDQWERPTLEEVQQLQTEYSAAFGPGPATTADQFQQIARFYAARDLLLLETSALGAAVQLVADQSDAELMLEYGDALRRTGFYEAALITYRYTTTSILQEHPQHALLAGRAWQGQARALDALGQENEADLAVATARQIFSLIDPATLSARSRLR